MSPVIDWKHYEDEVSKWNDRLYKPMDPKIIGFVATFLALGIRTSGSCQGHPEGGPWPFPWVSFKDGEEELLYEMVAAFYRQRGLPKDWEAVLQVRGFRLQCAESPKTKLLRVELTDGRLDESHPVVVGHLIRLTEMYRFNGFLRDEAHKLFFGPIAVRKALFEERKPISEKIHGVTDEIANFWSEMK